VKNAPALLAAFVLVLLPILAACEHEPTVAETVDLYLLDAYETTGNGPGIDAASVVLEADPLLPYADLLSYDSVEYCFRVSSEGRERVEGMEHSVMGVAFAMTVSGEVIYTGYFVPAYSSLALDWIVIDPIFWGPDNRMCVNLSYPGPLEGSVNPDPRNDPRILEVFERDGKLE
jgi:hypothetical protein